MFAPHRHFRDRDPGAPRPTSQLGGHPTRAKNSQLANSQLRTRPLNLQLGAPTPDLPMGNNNNNNDNRLAAAAAAAALAKPTPRSAYAPFAPGPLGRLSALPLGRPRAHTHWRLPITPPNETLPRHAATTARCGRRRPGV